MKYIVTLSIALFAAFSFSFGQTPIESIGASANWNDGFAWDLGVVPDNTYNVTILGDPDPGSADQITITVSATSNNLNINQNASLIVNSTLVASGNLTMETGSTLTATAATTITGNITVNGNATFDGSSSISGTDLTVASGGSLTIGVSTTVHDLTLSSNATLTLNGGESLVITGDLLVQTGATFTCVSNNNTLVTFNHASVAQSITNNSANSILMQNLTIDNDVTITAGNVDLTRSLIISSGTFDVDGSFTFLSTSSRTATVQNLGSGASMTGNVTVNRFVNTRTANWCDIASPVIGATVSDLDNEVYISGVVGADGYVPNTNGGAFTSMWWLNSATQSYVAVGNVSETMTNGRGYEMWLADNSTSWTSKAWDLSGTISILASTPISLSLNTGWNLLGNPYPAFLNFETILQNFASTEITNNEFWAYSASNGGFISFNDLSAIPPGQGFWVHTSTGSPDPLVIDVTADLRNSNSSTFNKYEYIPNKELRLTIKNLDSERPQASSAYLRYDRNAYAGRDSKDIPIIRRPDPENCLLSFDNNGSKNMVNYVSTEDAHLELPLSLESRMEADFTLSFTGLDQFSEYQCVNLYNSTTGEMTPINGDETINIHLTKDQPSAMTLIMSKDDYTDCSLESVFSATGIKISSVDKTIIADFALEKSVKADIKIYDVMGNLVLTEQRNVSYSREAFPLDHISSGVYLINVTINGESQTEKVVLR